MRKIIFRGKRIDNGEWVQAGNLIHFNNEGIEQHYYIPEYNDKCVCIHDDNDNILAIEKGTFYKVIPETVGQYTGLTDKNGKKIFEGDIVRCKYANVPKIEHIQKVVFVGCKFMAEFSNGGSYSVLYDGARHLPFDKSAYMTEIEVIGNIHDNPELLKGGADNGNL